MRLLGRWPLLRFGAPRTVVEASGVLIRFPIVGGRLARSPGGSITFAQAVAPAIELRATIDGFYPAPQRTALPPRAAAHPHEREPALLHAPAGRGAAMRVVVFGATGSSARRSCRCWRASTMSSPSRAANAGRNGRCQLGARRCDRRRPPCARRSRAPTSPTTSCTRSARRDFAELDRGRRDRRPRGRARGRVPDRLPRRARRRLGPISRRTCAAASKRRRALASGQRPRDDAPRRDGRRARAAPPSRRSSRSSIACPRWSARAGSRRRPSRSRSPTSSTTSTASAGGEPFWREHSTSAAPTS